MSEFSRGCTAPSCAPEVHSSHRLGSCRTHRRSLLSVRTEGGFDTLLAGHGLPASGGELTQAIKYLNFANEVAASATSADEVIAALTAEFPGYDVEGILQFWGLFFQ